jgi:hypothetical protein
VPAGLVLDKVASVWRQVPVTPTSRTRNAVQVYEGIKCAIVPISSFDAAQPYRYESTHIVFAEAWLVLRKEDEVRYGRRLPDTFGNVLAEVFVIQGRRRYSESVQLAMFYAKEGE